MVGVAASPHEEELVREKQLCWTLRLLLEEGGTI